MPQLQRTDDSVAQPPRAWSEPATTPDFARQSDFIQHYGALAYRAMLAEVNLTPKPGLVDRVNCGAHQDMTLLDFITAPRRLRRGCHVLSSTAFISVIYPGRRH